MTADLEDGYGLPPDDLVRRIVDSSACGLNLEDSDHGRNALIPMDEQAERIRAIRAAALANGADVVTRRAGNDAVCRAVSFQDGARDRRDPPQ